jgi:hypothetical protein
MKGEVIRSSIAMSEGSSSTLVVSSGGSDDVQVL